jgi:hypothetical protein
MHVHKIMIPALLITVATSVGFAQGKDEKKAEAISFRTSVFPIIKAKCLPCHAEDNFNPSELNMDSYEAMMKGGKHGELVKAGKSKESLLLDKLSEKPKFGDRMPLNSKKKIADGRAVWLSDSELKTIATWVDQGAKDN